MKKSLIIIATLLSSCSSCVSDYERVVEIQQKFPNSIVSTNYRNGEFYVIDTVNCNVMCVDFYPNSKRIANYYRIH